MEMEVSESNCLPRAIVTAPDPGGSEYPTIACNVIEAQPSDRCDCGQPGRSATPEALVTPVLKQLTLNSRCGADGQASCNPDDFCVCQIIQETGADLSACVQDLPVDSAGFCYIEDPKSPALQQCLPSIPRRFRFVAEDSAKIPMDGAHLFIACEGMPVP
jgi:hypothetical protein